MPLPKSKNLQEIANEEVTAQFLQEVIEPEINIPVEPQVLFEDAEEINIKSDDNRVIIKAGRLNK
jgi:hypothetical protein